jgi:hypothetical protein
MKTTATRDTPIRRYLRDNITLMYPERAIGRDPSINLAEVESALSRRYRRRRRQPAPPPPSPAPTARRALPPRQPGNGPKLTNAAAARACGVSPAAMLKRVRKFGLIAALAMGGRNDNAKRGTAT